MKFLHVFSKLRVRPKLIAIFLVIGIVPMAIVGLISYRTSSNAQQHDALGAQRTFAYDSMDKLNRMIWERYGDAQAFAAGTAARSMDPKEITAFMNRMVAAYSPMYKVMAVTDANCKVIAVNTVKARRQPARFQQDRRRGRLRQAVVHGLGGREGETGALVHGEHG